MKHSLISEMQLKIVAVVKLCNHNVKIVVDLSCQASSFYYTDFQFMDKVRAKEI
jgi:hypothetical protein